MGVIHQVRLMMENNEYLRKLVPIIRDTSIMQRRASVRLLTKAQKEQTAFKAFYETHREEFEKLSQMLADEFSRRTLQTIIDYRLAPAPELLWGG